MSEHVDDFLQHYGVVGMKWGKRSGGLKSRMKGAQMDRVHNARSIINRKLDGKSTLEEKVLFAPDRLLMGKKRHEKFLNKKLSQLDAMEERAASGKRTVRDKLDLVMGSTLLDLAVSRRDNKG